jgi:hypothetical protein
VAASPMPAIVDARSVEAVFGRTDGRALIPAGRRTRMIDGRFEQRLPTARCLPRRAGAHLCRHDANARARISTDVTCSRVSYHHLTRLLGERRGPGGRAHTHSRDPGRWIPTCRSDRDRIPGSRRSAVPAQRCCRPCCGLAGSGPGAGPLGWRSLLLGRRVQAVDPGGCSGHRFAGALWFLARGTAFGGRYGTPARPRGCLSGEIADRS